MSDFEKWFVDQDFYTNMRFIHGDNLFSKDGDVYRVLLVQMANVAWSEKQSEYAELKEVSVALNTETINQRRYMASQQAIIDNLKAQLNNMEACYIEKKKQVEAVDAVLMNWRDEYTEFAHQHECTVDAVLGTCIAELEQALRGEND